MMNGTVIHRTAVCRPQKPIFSPLCRNIFRTPPNVVEPENVPELMFVEPEILEAVEADVDAPATSSGSDLQPPTPPAPQLSCPAPLKRPPGMEKMLPYMGDVCIIGTALGTCVKGSFVHPKLFYEV